jgi:hypothetical protein
VITPSCCPNRWPLTRSSGDDIELVALDVRKGRPPCVALLELAELLAPEVHKTLRFGEEAVADEVEVKTVLDDLGLGHAVERQAGSAAGFVRGEKNSIFRSDRSAAAVGGDHGAGHVAGLRRCQKGDDLGDFFWLRRPAEEGCAP